MTAYGMNKQWHLFVERKLKNEGHTMSKLNEYSQK